MHYLVFSSIDERPDRFETYGDAMVEALRLVDKIKSGKLSRLTIDGDSKILIFRIELDGTVYTPWVQLRTIDNATNTEKDRKFNESFGLNP